MAMRKKPNDLAREITFELIGAGHVRHHAFTAVTALIQTVLDTSPAVAGEMIRRGWGPIGVEGTIDVTFADQAALDRLRRGKPCV